MSYQPHQSEDVTLKPVAPPAPVYEREEGMPNQYLAEDDVFTLIGQAEYMRRVEGEEDMPRYFLELAERIARTLGDIHLAARCSELRRLPAPPTGGKEE